MAFTYENVKISRGTGDPATVLVSMYAKNGGSDTSGSITKAETIAGAFDKVVFKEVLNANFSNDTAQRAPEVNISWDATTDAMKVDFVCASGDSFWVTIVGADNGTALV